MSRCLSEVSEAATWVLGDVRYSRSACATRVLDGGQAGSVAATRAPSGAEHASAQSQGLYSRVVPLQATRPQVQVGTKRASVACVCVRAARY
eukprot:3067288-Rhodomonas_salina.3